VQPKPPSPDCAAPELPHIAWPSASESLAPPKPPERPPPRPPLVLPRSVYAEILKELCLAPNSDIRTIKFALN
jgi:hypothetical protein